MAKLSKKTRASLPSSVFGLPEKRAFPVPDASHARLAKSIASRQMKTGVLTPDEKRRIDNKANKVLGKSPTRGKK